MFFISVVLNDVYNQSLSYKTHLYEVYGELVVIMVAERLQ